MSPANLSKKLKLLDLFSGIGGFSLGLERSGGFETIAFCEIESFCRKVLAKHWPTIPCYDDIKTLTKDRLHADGIVPDAICGGFPCQDISTAGKGAGITGKKAAYGVSTRALLAKYDRVTSSWRTWQLCLDGDFQEFSETWPRSGMMQNGIAFKPVRSGALVREIDCGLLPSPMARDYRDLSRPSPHLAARERHSPSLVTRLLSAGVHWSAIMTAYESVMGYPLGWSEIASTRSEIRSSRK